MSRGASLPSISQAEMSLLQPVYYRYLFTHGLEDTPERLEIAAVMWAAGGASALRRSASIGSTAPTMRELADLLLFADLLRESENGSAYWSSSGTDGEGASQSVPDYDTTPDDVADELGVHD